MFLKILKKTLEILGLSSNKLSKLDSSLFKGLDKLNYLDIRGNDLTVIKSEFIKVIKNLKSFKFGEKLVKNPRVHFFKRF